MTTRSGISLNKIAPDAPVTHDLRTAVAAVLESVVQVMARLPEEIVFGVYRDDLDALRAAYDATPESPVTASLWRAARDAVDSAMPLVPGRYYLDTASVYVLAAALDATPEPSPAITAEEIARTFRNAEVAWYLEHAPNIGVGCAGFDGMNERAKASSIAGANAVLARLAGRT